MPMERVALMPWGAGDLLDRLQQGELVLAVGGQVLLLEDKQVAVPVVPAQQAVGRGNPLGDLPLNAGADLGAPVVGGVADQLLIVVDGEDGHHRAGGVVLVPDVGQFGDVQPVGGGDEPLLALLARVDQMAEDTVAATADGVLRGALGPALHEPVGGEVGDGGGDVGVKEVLPLPEMERNRSLLQMTSPFSGRKITMGKGEFIIVSLPALSILWFRAAMKRVTFCCRRRLVMR